MKLQNNGWHNLISVLKNAHLCIYICEHWYMLIHSKLSSFFIAKEYALLEKVMRELFTILLYYLNVTSILIQNNQYF